MPRCSVAQSTSRSTSAPVGLQRGWTVGVARKPGRDSRQVVRCGNLRAAGGGAIPALGAGKHRRQAQSLERKGLQGGQGVAVEGTISEGESMGRRKPQAR
ncbi:hypothetical protein AWV80_04700 [Cupriavidus sp. UYMU48A]|nr:hypothetical protein AWV80_04700 [Cupriavidus sp. UYMU48A]